MRASMLGRKGRRDGAWRASVFLKWRGMVREGMVVVLGYYEGRLVCCGRGDKRVMELSY